MAQSTFPKTQISLGSLVKDFVTYNAWANNTLVNWLRTKPAELFDQEVASSFPSLKQTLVHIWDTERFWFSVIKQVPPPPSFRQHGFNGTLEDVLKGIIQQSEEFDAYVNSLSESALQENVYFHTPWVEGTRTRFEFIHHCMNHSTYHRGQLITIGRHVGLTDAPMTDYSFYFLMAKETQFLAA